MGLIILYSAEVDLQKAFERYETRSSGFGMEFLGYVESGLNQIKQFPKSGFEITEKHRRVLLKKFPYGIFYSIYPKRIDLVVPQGFSISK